MLFYEGVVRIYVRILIYCFNSLKREALIGFYFVRNNVLFGIECSFRIFAAGRMYIFDLFLTIEKPRSNNVPSLGE